MWSEAWRCTELAKVSVNYLPHTNNIISSNHVYNHSGNGIWLCDSPNNNTITLNHVYKNVRGIDITSSSNNTVTLNQIYDNSYGICLLSFTNNNIITSNQIYNNSYGIWLKKSSNNEIHYNNIYNNTNYGVNNYNSESQYVANATNNWWGSSDGPGVTGANPVSSNVIYEPWLTELWTAEAENQPPTVSIISPSSGSTVSGTITVQGVASDPDGTVQSVDVSIDDHHARDHAASHKSAGADTIRIDEFKEGTDVVTLDSSIARHGLLKKLDNDAAHFMNGQGTWAAAGGGETIDCWIHFIGTGVIAIQEIKEMIGK